MTETAKNASVVPRELGTSGPRRKRSRKAVALSVCVLVLLLAGGGVTAAIAIGASHEPPAARTAPGTGTATVQRGTLRSATSAAGTLQYSGASDIAAAMAGVVTWLPTAGATIGLGHALFAVNDQQIYLFTGQLPAWRALQAGMTAGPDVQQLEESLKTLGYFSGTPNETFTWSTKVAIQAWQNATGQEQTGAIDLGRIVFQGGDVRISDVKLAAGNTVGPGAPVVSVTSLDKQVTVDLQLADQGLGVVGAKVDIRLPDGKTTKGTVQSVGVPTEKDNGQGGKAVTVPVVVTLDDPAAAGNLQQASVTVEFPSESRENVLSVPVAALLALPGGKFGVEVVQPDGTTKRVPVKIGLFAGGRVEISGDGDGDGDGVGEGDTVTVPEL
jgi:hypothetical protein